MKLNFFLILAISSIYVFPLWSHCTRWECEADAVHAIQCLIDMPAVHPNCAQSAKEAWLDSEKKGSSFRSDFATSLNLLNNSPSNRFSFSRLSVQQYNEKFHNFKNYFKEVNQAISEQGKELQWKAKIDAAYQLEYGFLNGMKVPEQLRILETKIANLLHPRLNKLIALSKSFTPKQAARYFLQYSLSQPLEQDSATIFGLILKAEADAYFIGALRREYKNQLPSFWKALRQAISELEKELFIQLHQDI